MTRYLRRINKTWTQVIGDKEADQLRLDANTVAILQGRCPMLSLEDRAHVQNRMLAGDIFPAVKADDQRSQIFDRSCAIEHVIPSIHTFLENTKYLEPPARILKQLLPGKCKGSMSQHFNALHGGQVKVKVQTSEFTFEDRTSSSGRSSWLSYRQLWLFALVTFPSWTASRPGESGPSRVPCPQEGSRDGGVNSLRWRQRTGIDGSVVCTAIAKKRTPR